MFPRPILKIRLFQSYTSVLQRLGGAGRGGKTQLLKKKKRVSTKIFWRHGIYMSTGDGSNCWYGVLWPPWPLGKQVLALFFSRQICSLDSATISFPTTKFLFVAECNHIMKSNKKWLWLNNFRLARLAAPLLAAALNKVFFSFKIALLNSHQGQGFQNCTAQFSSMSQFENITIDFFFSRLAWWLSSNVVSLTISWRLCWKRRDYKEGGLDKNPNFKESKIQNTKKVVLIKIRATLPCPS